MLSVSDNTIEPMGENGSMGGEQRWMEEGGGVPQRSGEGKQHSSVVISGHQPQDEPEQIVRDESFLGGEQKNVLPPTFLLFFFVMDFFPPLV